MGYNFTHNSTAEVRYPNSANPSAGGSKSASTQAKAIDPAILAENQANKAKVKELDTKIQELQKYKSTAETTIQKFKSEYEYANSENMQLTTSLESMKRKINEAREQAGQLQRLTEARDNLEQDIKVLQDQLKEYKDKCLASELKISDLTNDKQTLAQKLSNLENAMENATVEKIKLEEKLEDFSKQFRKKAVEDQALKSDYSKLQTDFDKLSKDIQGKNAQILKNSDELFQRSEKIVGLEKQQLSLNMDVEALRSQLKELQAERVHLQSKAQESKSTADVGQDVKDQLDELKKSKKALEVDLAELNKKNAILSMELQNALEKQKQSSQSEKAKDAEIDAMSSKLEALQKEHSALSLKKLEVENLYQALQAEFKKVKSEKRQSQGSMLDLQNLIKDTEQKCESLKRELEQMSIKYQAEVRNNGELKEKAALLESQKQEEKTLRISLERKLETASQNETTDDSQGRLQNKIDHMVLMHQNEVKALREELQQHETELKVMNMNLIAERNMREEIESKTANKLERQNSALNLESRIRSDLETRLQNTQQRIVGLLTKIEVQDKELVELRDFHKAAKRVPTAESNAANKGFFQRGTVKRNDNRLSMMPIGKDVLADSPAPAPIPEAKVEPKTEKSPERVERLADKLAEKPADKNILRKMRQSAFFSKPKDLPAPDAVKGDKDHKRMSSQLSHQSIDSLKVAIQEKSKLQYSGTIF